MEDQSVNLALVAIVGTVITALFKLLADNTKALGRLVHSSERVAEATQKAAREAKDRNGHLGEQSIQIATLVKEGNDIDHKILNHLETSSERTATLLKENTAPPAHEVKVVAENLKASQE